MAIVTLSDGTQPAESAAGKSAWAFCGLGNPESFYRTLESLGIHLAGRTTFNDHHAYAAADLTRIVKDADAAGAQLILTTAKDAVKLAGLDPVLAGRIASLHVELAFLTGQDGLEDRLRATAPAGR